MGTELVSKYNMKRFGDTIYSLSFEYADPMDRLLHLPGADWWCVLQYRCQSVRRSEERRLMLTASRSLDVIGRLRHRPEPISASVERDARTRRHSANPVSR